MNGRRMITCLFIFLFACNVNSKTALPEPPPTPVTIQPNVLTEGLAFPWEILWGPDNFIWMTERGGLVSRVNPASGAKQPVYQIPDVVSNGEGGLLGMVLHPGFLNTPYVYVVYDYNSATGYKEKVVRFTFSNNTLTAPAVLIDGIAAAGIHNGSRLLISGDKLFITTGDAANQPTAQNTATVNGKVLRLNLDGSIPADNPIPNNPVWTFGHRNPQGLVVAGNTLFEAEHGPDSDDEINVIEKGKNYGWPNVKGLCDNSDEQTFCAAHAVAEPIKTWTPTAATSGLDFYNNDAIPQWKNSLLLATLKNSRLYQLKLNAAQTEVAETHEFFENDYGRIRDICIAPNGVVYFCTSNGSNDKIVQVQAN